jgi:hypothetical protein
MTSMPGSVTSVAAERPSSSWLSLNSSQWIRGPVYDAVFFCALWWVPVSVLILGTTTAMASAVFFILYHLFIRVPHFAATANFTYFYQANREYCREHWIRYLAVPVAIVAAYTARPWFESRSIYNHLLLSVATIWGMQHIAAQNFGVLSLYRGRSAARADSHLRSLEKACRCASVDSRAAVLRHRCLCHGAMADLQAAASSRRRRVFLRLQRAAPRSHASTASWPLARPRSAPSRGMSGCAAGCHLM